MMDCSSLYSDNKDGKKPTYLRLQEKGTVVIQLKGKTVNGNSIANLSRQLYFVINTYKSACKRIVIMCDSFVPADKLTYILFEAILYNLTVQYGYEVFLNLKTINKAIHTEGIFDSTIMKFPDYKRDLDVYKRRFVFRQNMTHFRRIKTTEELDGEGLSKLVGDLKTFFHTSGIVKENTDQLALVISELADNTGEHADADCLIDIDISKHAYTKSDDECGEYIAVNTVVLNFSSKCLGDDIKEKTMKHYYKDSVRYDAIQQAYRVHSQFFDKHYNEQDFFNVASFQDEISGRKGDTQTGGTGLTQLIKNFTLVYRREKDELYGKTAD